MFTLVKRTSKQLKIKLFFSLFFLIVLCANAQQVENSAMGDSARKKMNHQSSFFHSVGVSFFYTGEYALPAFTYSPRFNLIYLRKVGTISLGTHSSFAFSGEVMLFDAPLVAEINIGNSSKRIKEKQKSSDIKEFQPKVGAFIGGGLGMNFATDFSPDGPTLMKGPILNIGIIHRSWGLRISYLKNIKDYKYEDDAVYSLGFFVGW